MANILMVLIEIDYPEDIRVSKEIQTLKSVHNVTLICSHKDKSRPAYEERQDVSIYRYPFHRAGWRKIYTVFELLFFVQWDKLKFFKTIIHKHNIDVIHVHDLHLVGTALKIALKKNIPLVADLHEPYPEMMHLHKSSHPIIRHIHSRKRWEIAERKWLSQVQWVITVVDEAKERLVQKGIPEQKIVVVSNTDDAKNYSNLRAPEALQVKYKDKFTLLYAGVFGDYRGIHTAIQALPYLLKESEDYHLILAGYGSNEDALKRLAEHLNLSKHVTFSGQISQKEVYEYIALADLCLVPHLQTGFTNATIPNKLFQYMRFGKPVLGSTCSPIRRIIEETKAGRVFEAGDPYDLSQKVLIMRSQLSAYGECGLRATEAKYNWQHEEQRLLDIYARLEKSS